MNPNTPLIPGSHAGAVPKGGGSSFTNDQPWSRDALCAQVGDHDLWYPAKGGSSREARSVCKVCPVKAECLQWALDTDQRYGVLGGTTERERAALKKGDVATCQLDDCDEQYAALPGRRFCSPEHRHIDTLRRVEAARAEVRAKKIAAKQAEKAAARQTRQAAS